MRVLVLGAGVIGVTTAWFLAQDGHEVTVLERQSVAGMETSFANGGQISASHAEPWANPRAPRKIMQWLSRDDAPLLFRPHADWQQWRWGLQFLIECLPGRTRRNTVQCVRLALYSLSTLRALREQTGIVYDHLERGILVFYTDHEDFEHDAKAAEAMRRYGFEREVISVDQSIAIEPALQACRDRLVGGIFTPGDESGDAHRFTQALAQRASEQGVAFRYGVAVESLAEEAGRIIGVRAVNAENRKEVLSADAYVMALGSYSPRVLRLLGIAALIYPVKGYSITIDIGDHRGAPMVSLTDPAWKIVITRLGGRLRVAGTAELDGYNAEINAARCDALVARTFDLFPDAGQREGITRWAGLRPATPSNVPFIGRTRYSNLWLNTGHGTLGWTMSAGSGKALADLIAGRRPEVDFDFIGG